MNNLEKEVLDLLKENDNFIEEVEEFKVIEDGDWISEHKYEIKDTIIQYKELYFRISESRTGSYYSDYHYEDPEVQQVEPKEEVKVVRTWTKVNS